MLQLELGTRANREIDCRQHSLLIVRMNILLQPVNIGPIRAGNKLTSFELAHLLPVSTHPIDCVGTSSNKCSIQRFAFAQLTRDSSALDAFPTSCSYESNEFKLVCGPIAWHTHVDCHPSDKLSSFVKRHTDT